MHYLSGDVRAPENILRTRGVVDGIISHSQGVLHMAVKPGVLHFYGIGIRIMRGKHS